MTGLRVISGTARGRKLRAVPGDSTRPITDRTKESLFDILGADIVEATLLDLFAGTGSVGIEALSRGAKFVRFNDLQRQAIETIRANLEIAGFKQGNQLIRCEVFRLNAFTLLERPVDRSFDYIYIAPPQYKGLWKETLAVLDQNPRWLNADAWIIVQIHPIEYEMLEFLHFSEFDRRQYGSTLLVFYATNT